MKPEVIVITETEIAQGLVQYEKAMCELAALLGAPNWGKIGVCFGHWSNDRDEPWQVSFIEAKHYIVANGKSPWEVV